jgi:hypothetical protein
VFTALEDFITGVEVVESIWKVADPEQAIATYDSTADGCSFNIDNPTFGTSETRTLQPDDSAPGFGDESRVFSVGSQETGFPSGSGTIVGYLAAIIRGNLFATVYITTGTSGTIADSTLTAIFSAAAHRLS